MGATTMLVPRDAPGQKRGDYRAIALFVLGAMCAVRSPAVASSESLDFVRDAHKGSREAITTLSCEVRFSRTVGDGKTTQSCAARYWYSPAATRMKVNDSNAGMNEMVWKDSLMRSLRTRQASGTQDVAATLSKQVHRFTDRCDAWARGLQVLSLPGTVYYVPFEDLLQHASEVRSVERRSLEGRELIVVKLRFDYMRQKLGRWDVEVRFDPSVNHLVRSTEYIVSDGDSKHARLEEVVRFKECAPGLFFPERVEGKYGAPGATKDTSTTDITEIRVNQRLSDESFKLRYPNGVLLTDSVRGMAYRIDQDGNQISEAMQLGRVPGAGYPDTPPAGGTETVHEPRPWTQWLLLASAVLLVLGLSIHVAKRMRKSTGTT